MTAREGSDPLVRLTVNLTSKAHVALEEASARLGDTPADTVNRALALYAEIVKVAGSASGAGRFDFDLTHGALAVLEVRREIAPRA